LSKRWNVARLTSEISSSPKKTRNGTVFCGGISAADPPADAARDSPAIPSTGAALAVRFRFNPRFVCDMAEFLLDFSSNKCATKLSKSVTFSVRFEQHKAGWLPGCTYRTMCLAPQPEFRAVLEHVRSMQLAA
jgi:hypothetical protein